MNALIFIFNHHFQARESSQDVCVTQLEEIVQGFNDTKLEMPWEKADDVKGRSCLVSGFYLDASGWSIKILKSFLFPGH